MSDQDRRQAQPEPGQEGSLFGKLPSARPGVRSPRRATGGEKGRSAPKPKTSQSTPGQVGRRVPASAGGRRNTETASPGVRPPDTPGRGSALPRTQPETAREPEASEPRDAPGVEDIAWAGVTVAAEAATLGVRLLSRAIDAVRKPADPR
jgi:hypothetical protein